ncbi:AT-hook motif nuclear-localized protein 9-like [Henckelia pumila]|uniref:AT-hook motif nuclear-localized protein 9-like n=1 Tax=Henckelia pumila TaxID=405737 RepID=UPI003C6E138F
MNQDLPMEEQIPVPASVPFEPLSPGEENADNMDDENINGGSELVRKKRERPRNLGRQEQQKRGRGRPRGSGKWQTLAATFGGIAVSAAAGSHFTPYMMIIPTGENISQKIWSVSQSQRVSDSMCVLSAAGTVSVAEIMQPGLLGATVKYEGRFDIVSLNGSHIYTERGNGGRRVARLSIQLANPDGHIFGGVVGGSLIAAVPTQLVVATFRQNTRDLPKARATSRTVAVASTAPPNAVIGNVINDPEENQASPSDVHENSPRSCPGL